jgi:hypothetical protein
VSWDGEWRIETTKRPFSADEIAVLLVRNGYRPPSTAGDILLLENVGVLVRDLVGTPDYGKL